jgi:hypothetical protein
MASGHLETLAMLVPHRALFSRITSASRYNDAACLKEQPSLGYCAASRVITRLRASCAEPLPDRARATACTRRCTVTTGVASSKGSCFRSAVCTGRWIGPLERMSGHVSHYLSETVSECRGVALVYAPLTFLEKTDI